MIVKRLKQYIDFKGISVSAFERSIGMANASFGKSLKNNGAIGTDKLENILRVYSDISTEWLLTGKGDMIKGDSNGVQTPVESKAELAIHVPEGSMEGIPLVPLSAMAGALTGDTTVMEFECERYVIPSFKGADFLTQVKGDSMQPTYYSGDLVACQKVPLSDLFFQWGKTYVLDTAQGPLIKRINPGSDSNHILIVSDNEAYKPFELSRDQFYSVALVRGIVRLE